MVLGIDNYDRNRVKNFLQQRRLEWNEIIVHIHQLKYQVINDTMLQVK